MRSKIRIGAIALCGLLGACGGRGGYDAGMPPPSSYGASQTQQAVPQSWSGSGTSYAPPLAQQQQAQQSYSPQYAPPPTPQTMPQDGGSANGTQPYYPPGATGPRGSSQAAPGEARYDQVGYAMSSADAAGFGTTAMFAASPTLPSGTFVEVTSINSGRIILVKVAAHGPSAPGWLVDLSPAAAQALGMQQGQALPVRVRTVEATNQDQAAINAGRGASPRIDAPRSLLTGLRAMLPATPPGATMPAPQPQPRPQSAGRPGATYRSTPAAPRPATAANGRYVVQVVALSHHGNAEALARKLGGFIVSGGGLYRVRLGPYADRAAAERARSQVAAKGYGGARIYDQK